jgi:hypothetical protein
VSALLSLDARGQRRLEDLESRYRGLVLDPAGSSPLIVISAPVPGLPTWEERLADPDAMLEAQLAELEPHLRMEDDRVSSVRVEFGTAQVAAAFGCSIFQPVNNLPCAGSHVLSSANDAFKLQQPDINAGWYARAWDWMARWKERLPAWVRLGLPDIQSPFNSAHLIRGNDILTDFYDEPAAVDRLLDVVTDFMLAVVDKAWSVIGRDDGWFPDWGGLWKGRARISNCSMHMISPAFYRAHVLPRDARFLEAVGGGRVHYCGSWPEVIREYHGLPGLTGLDFDWNIHDPALIDQCPAGVPLTNTIPLEPGSPALERLLAGQWPRKGNLMVTASAPSVREGRDLLRRLREAANLSNQRDS